MSQRQESISLVHEYMGQYSEALVVYDELEAHFLQTQQEQGTPWFPAFGGADDGDNCGNLLDLRRKPYRQMILNSTISIFDFRIYLFNRQIEVLQKSNQPQEICKRAKLFISFFSRTLHQQRQLLPTMFTQVWVYSSCLNVIKNVEESLSTTSNYRYQGYKGDLLHCARMQVQHSQCFKL